MVSYVPGISSMLHSLETSIASHLSTLSSTLASLSDHLSTTPVSTTCTSYLETIADTVVTTSNNVSPIAEALLMIVFSFLFLLVSVAVLYYLALCHYGPDPSLCAFPPPSHIYNPYEDAQSDLFGDDDVRPQLVPEGTPSAIQAIAPANGQTIGWVPVDSLDSVHEAVERARIAQMSWALTSFEQRRSVMRTLLKYILYEQKFLCSISSKDTGKTMLEASLGEIVPTLEKLRWLIAEGEDVLVKDFRSTGPMTRHKRAKVEYMPLGVIGAIAPWNYPIHNFLNPVIAALFSGNAVVVKPSEYSLYASLYIGRVVRRTLSLCGHSAELVQVIVGKGEIGAELLGSHVDKVFFTGSTKIGKMVALAAAKRLLPVTLELGGKDPLIVCDDAEIAHAATICMRGVFQNAGQNCIGVERVFVHELVMDKFCALVVDSTKSIRLGVDMGAMTMGEVAIKEIQNLVDDAVEQGAQILEGGKMATVEGEGFYYEPTVLKGVTPKMRIAKEEVFGPVMSLLEWNNDEELVRMVNSCSFGLGSSIFTEDKVRANRMVSALRVGMSNVNDFATNYLCQSMPFGGTKQSGSDKFAGIEGLRGCCIAKATTRDRFPGIKTRIPKAFQYPIRHNAFEMSAEINDLFYGQRTIGKLDNLRNMLGMLIRPRWRPRSVASG